VGAGEGMAARAVWWGQGCGGRVGGCLGALHGGGAELGAVLDELREAAPQRAGAVGGLR